MFRVVTTSDPMFFLLCDNSNCAQAASQPIDPSILQDEAEQNKTALGFMEARRLEGWLWGLEAQLCPGCVVRRAERVRKLKQEQSGIVGATTADLARLKKAGVN